MADLDKVLKGFEAHADGCGYRSHHCDVMDCPYRYGDESCDIEEMCRDALELLKSQQAEIERLEQENGTLKLAVQSMPNWLNEKRPEVVRCKNCNFGTTVFDDGDRFCELEEEWRDPDSFCANGKPKDGDGE